MHLRFTSENHVIKLTKEIHFIPILVTLPFEEQSDGS
jgi:hypothetical protein